MQTPISITRIASVSSLGTTPQGVWKKYTEGTPAFSRQLYEDQEVWMSTLDDIGCSKLVDVKNSNTLYKDLDRSVLLALLASRKALSKPCDLKGIVGVNIGSSRGATELFEKYVREYDKTGRVSTLASPTTTLGNISSWVGQELGLSGPVISHSVTCATSLQAVVNAIAWLQSDMANAFVVGGSEAPLTTFTIAQMQALKLYSRREDQWACQALKMDKTANTMVLGEAGVIAVLEKGKRDKAMAVIRGYGVGSESLVHNVSISQDALCLQQSMKMALKVAGLQSVDVLVMHAPGTIQGDAAEMAAIQEVFRNKTPALTTNKSILGHTLGASGMMSLEMAVQMLKRNTFIDSPFYTNETAIPSTLKHIMINAVGFGGNAVSLIISDE